MLPQLPRDPVAPFPISQRFLGNNPVSTDREVDLHPSRPVDHPSWNAVNILLCNQKGEVPVTSWTRLGSCALRAGIKQSVSEHQARTSSGRDGVNVQLRGLDGNPSCRRLVHYFVPPVKPGDVCGCSTNVKPVSGQKCSRWIQSCSERTQ